ncbi:MAG TPA: cytochrome c oxidase subunit II [Candidatus Acidoferrum sp.]|nr:cytochrome c oxidase subunit II [Candidatus Acidoferrum sp.]
MKFPLLPPEASQVATRTDHLYSGLLCISTLVVFLVFGTIVVFLFKYRRGKPAPRSHLPLPELKIELTWTIVPTLIFLGFFTWGAELYWNIERPPTDALEIHVIGKQWMWKIEHAEGNREINELHVPVGRVVKLTLASQDVIHSFFLPAFRIKQDVVPGRYTALWFKADHVGQYHLLCSEYCGTHHSAMNGSIYVMSQPEFQQWLAKGQPQSTLAQEGERLFRQYGCSGCHVNSTSVRAPPLEGLYGKPVPLQTGQIVLADEAYLRDSILQPAKDIVAGYTNDMPSFQGHISEEELVEVIAYLRSLGTTTPALPASQRD